MVTRQLVHVTRALVCCVIVTLSLFSGVSSAVEPKPLNLEITTHLGDKQTFIEGDVVSFLLSLDDDAFIYLFYEDADANLIEIFPNSKSRNHFYKQGIFLPVPPEQARFQLKIQAPFGKEKLYVFASDNADINLHGRLLDNGLRLIDDIAENLAHRIRRQSESAFGSTSLTIETKAR